MFLTWDRKQRFVKKKNSFLVSLLNVSTNRQSSWNKIVWPWVYRHEAPPSALSCWRHNLEGSQCEIFRTNVGHVACNVKTCSINALKAGSVTRMYQLFQKIILFNFFEQMKWPEKCGYRDNVCLLHGVSVYSVKWCVREEMILLKTKVHWVFSMCRLTDC